MFNISSAELFLKELKELNEFVVKTFDVHYDIGLYTISFTCANL